ncbi:hypothetical protein PN836_000545 [Ningiella sp. W23]|uniref:hypothetical protein n=1 Tax=Ningiella sp. W23 TaxID=3023715 RepID=UPI00375730C6
MEIVLVRHGKPASASNQKLNAAGFANWVRNYNHALVSDSSRPNTHLRERFDGFYVVSSDLPRAIDSAKI